MADGTQRPTFFHGEVLGADKLNGVVSYDNAQHGRHRRMLHTWGIAEGLELAGKERRTAGGETYFELSLTAGVAVDAYGYELVSAVELPIAPGDFLQANVQAATGDAWYPVFVVGVERQEADAGGLARACRSDGGIVVREEIRVEFGKPGAQRELDAQDPDGIALEDGPGTSGTRPRWRILVGYVQWNDAIERFVAHQSELAAADVADPSEAVPRRWIGVRAEQVLAPAGTLYLRSAPHTAAGTAALAVNYDDNLLVVGTHDGMGGIKPLVRFKANGDVESDGFIAGATEAGVHVQSGIATDGMILPLPAGITQAQIDGGAEMHISVTPRYSIDMPAVAGAFGASGVPFPSEVWVDDERRLHCRIRWLSLITAIDSVLPGTADYQVIVTVRGGA